jgi:hypothetical protein
VIGRPFELHTFVNALAIDGGVFGGALCRCNSKRLVERIFRLGFAADGGFVAACGEVSNFRGGGGFVAAYGGFVDVVGGVGKFRGVVAACGGDGKFRGRGFVAACGGGVGKFRGVMDQSDRW